MPKAAPRNDNLVEWTLMWVSTIMRANEYTPNEVKQHLVHKRAQLDTMTPASIALNLLVELHPGVFSGPH